MTLILTLALFLTACGHESGDSRHTEEPIGKMVIDDAYVLLHHKEMMKMYRDYNTQMLKDFDIDFRVVTTISAEDINIFANKAFAQLQAESRSKSGKALLLVVNTLQDKVRMEVSMALEPVYTDAYVSYVERKGMVPYLRDSKIADGVYMMTELARDRAYEASEGKEFMPPMQSKSIGGGAKTKANIGVVDKNAKKGDMVLSQNSQSPKTVLKRYINEVLKKHNKNPDLDIYTDATKAFFAKWTVTEINQDHEVHNLAPCTEKMEELYDSSRTHAVLAVKPYEENRKCSPYFFKKEQGRWKLDIATMAQILRFNQNMQFHFDKEKRLEGEAIYYAYAFDGIGLDKNGYPFKVDHPKTDDMRWGFQCGEWYKPEERNRVHQEPKKYTRCWINNIWNGSPADIRLGLDVYDNIVSLGEGENKKENVTYFEFMEYMQNIPSGEIATIGVSHYDKATKQRTKMIRRGIAP